MTVLAGLVLATTGTAQETVGTLDVSAGDVQRMIEVGENNPMGSIDAGQHVVFVWYEARRPQPEADDLEPVGIRHTQLTEIY